MLSIRDVSVSYEQKTILDSISLELKHGQWLMLAGPNGAGKSTLVSALSKAIAYNGSIKLQGINIQEYEPRTYAQKLAVLSQNHSLNYSFAVEEVVALGRYAWSHGPLSESSSQDREMVEQALEQTGLIDHRQQSVLTLSGGEIQRMFLAQVLAQNPEILLLDEPANHLDIVYQYQVFDILSQWVKQPGRAIISVVHDLSIAKAYGSHALLLNQGRTVAFGPCEEVLIPENLDEVYSIDVYGWMQRMLSQWHKS